MVKLSSDLHTCSAESMATYTSHTPTHLRKTKVAVNSHLYFGYEFSLLRWTLSSEIAESYGNFRNCFLRN